MQTTFPHAIRRPSLWPALLLAIILAHTAATDDLVLTDVQGRLRVQPYPVPPELLNPWPDEWEDAFWDHANAAIRKKASPGGYGNTYFENEKRLYPNAMYAFLGGFRQPALKALQEEDNQAKSWNSLTEGIDFFPAFTLKGQMRKYFLFGPYLEPEYRQRMQRGAAKWTAEDPLRRANPFWQQKQGGWTPETMNSWVDVRNTDNLQAMRETSVYLMAEETGNEKVRQLYEDRIRTFVDNLYQVGMGEWDSNNYHGHTLAAYLNLYDFAKNRQVQTLAKAALDYFAAAGAVKYYRGAFTGPNKRDYNHFVAFSGSAADHLALWFGDFGDQQPQDYEADLVHLITSAYRPPQAVVELARKNFPKPVELFLAHASYEALRKGAEKPHYFETTYIGHTFQLGTLAQGTGDGDVNGFRLAAYNSRRGADFFIANATTNADRLGSPQYGNDQVGRMNVGQFRHLAILLNAPGDSPLLFITPKDAQRVDRHGITFLAYEKTWLAIHPVNLGKIAIDEEQTRKINYQWDKNKNAFDDSKPRHPHLQILAAHGTGGNLCGFALEVGERETHGDFNAFVDAVASRAKLNLAAADDGTVAYTGSDGRTLQVTFGDLPTVVRNGRTHDWTAHTALYANADGGKAPISLGWKTGHLHVEAGGKTFAATIAK